MITSSQNPKLKLIRALMTHTKTRREEGKLVLEGARLIADVIQQGYRPDFVLYKAGTPAPWQAIECLPVEPHLFDDLSDTETSQGLLAVFPIPQLALSPQASLVLALDGLSDPGNLGTILRTAAAAGVEGVFLLPGTVDHTNPKVVRAGMGAHFRLPIFPMEWEGFKNRFDSGWQICAADVTPARAYDEKLWHKPTVLIIGNEAHGLSQHARQMATQLVYIPMAAGVESLNSSIAAGVILFEIQRQRKTQK